MEKEEYEYEEVIIKEESPKKEVDISGLSEYEKEIISIIENGDRTQNLIEEKISFGAQRLTALLGMMEIKGIIKKGPDKKYEVTRRGC